MLYNTCYITDIKLYNTYNKSINIYITHITYMLYNILTHITYVLYNIY